MQPESQKSLLRVAFEVRMSQDDVYLRKASLCPHRSASERPAAPHTQHARGLLGTGSEVSSSAHSTLVCSAAPGPGSNGQRLGWGSEAADL